VPAAGALLSVIVASATIAIVKVPASSEIEICWPPLNPSLMKLPSSEPRPRLIVFPEMVMLPLNMLTGCGPPIAWFVIEPPGVTLVWPSVISWTLTLAVGALVSLSP